MEELVKKAEEEIEKLNREKKDVGDKEENFKEIFCGLFSSVKENFEGLLQNEIEKNGEELKKNFLDSKLFPQANLKWTNEHFNFLIQFENLFQNIEKQLENLFIIYKKINLIQISQKITKLKVSSFIEQKMSEIRKKMKSFFQYLFKFHLENLFQWPKAKHKISLFPFDEKNANFDEIDAKIGSKEFENFLISRLILKMKEENNKISTQNYFELSLQFFIIFSVQFQIFFSKFKKFNLKMIKNRENNNENNKNNKNNNDENDENDEKLTERKEKRMKYSKLWILSSLITPIHHRFHYYFNQNNIIKINNKIEENKNNKNNLKNNNNDNNFNNLNHNLNNDKKKENLNEKDEKIEFFTSFILNKINDHSEFLLLFIQPAITFNNSKELKNYNIKIEFIKNLILIINQKLFTIFPFIVREKQTLFCHSLSTLFHFHQTLLLFHSYPPNFHPFSFLFLFFIYFIFYLFLKIKF